MSDAFNFEKEVERMTNNPPIDGSSSIIIWGGVFDAEKFKDFVSAWNFDDLPYIIREHAHKIEFQIADSTVNQNSALLERMEIFNASGNLSLRRNGNEFLWHFIGNDSKARQETLSKLETAKFTVRKFWEENSTCKLYQRDESALLWGEYDGERWHDDRVGWANLNYPIGPKNRVQIDYTIFTENGQTAFVWWKNLDEWKEARQHG